MDTARAARQSWPETNPRFQWPPDPPKRKRPGRDTGAFPSFNIAEGSLINFDSTAQRAVDTALRRAAAIDRTVGLLRDIGRHTAAERLACRATELRQAALA